MKKWKNNPVIDQTTLAPFVMENMHTLTNVQSHIPLLPTMLRRH